MLKRIVRRKQRGYSIAEIIISMALLIMLTSTGFAVCVTSLRIQKRAQDNVYIWNTADLFRTSFEDTLFSLGIASEETEKKLFVVEFNRRLAFGLNTPVPETGDLSGFYGLTGSQWYTRAVAESRLEYEPILDESGQPLLDENGRVIVQQVHIPTRALELNYCGSKADGTASYKFLYRYYDSFSEIQVSADLFGTEYTLTITGEQPDGSVIYTYEEVYFG